MNRRGPVLVGMMVVLASLAYVAVRLSGESLATPLDLEELVAIVAVTTFLVGFSTVRLQSRLDDYRVSVARHIDRVIEENNQANLLPSPPGMREYRVESKFEAGDGLFLWTERCSVFNLILSAFLIWLHVICTGVESCAAETTGSPLLGFGLMFVLHLFIVGLGYFAGTLTKRQADQEIDATPFARYRDLEQALQRWLWLRAYPDATTESNAKLDSEIRARIKALDEVLPSWAWISLISCCLQQNLPTGARDEYSVGVDVDSTDIERIFEWAKVSKDIDEYSRIAYVWSAYLRESYWQEDENSTPFIASARIMLSDIVSVRKFMDSCRVREQRSGYVYAALALSDVERVVGSGVVECESVSAPGTTHGPSNLDEELNRFRESMRSDNRNRDDANERQLAEQNS